jgi:hypothetical protein
MGDIVSDHWLNDHLEQIRQQQALQDAQFMTAQLAAHDETARAQAAAIADRHDQDELLRRQTAPCPACGTPSGSSGQCASCIAAERSAAELPSIATVIDYGQPGRDVADADNAPSLSYSGAEAALAPSPTPFREFATDQTREATAWIRDAQESRRNATQGDRPILANSEMGGPEPSQRSALDAFLSPKLTKTEPQADRPRVEPPSDTVAMKEVSREQLREDLASAESRQRRPGPTEYYCGNCQAFVSTPGYCATCGLLLKGADELINGYLEMFSPELHFVDPTYAVDMRDTAGATSETALGFVRDSRAFWRTMLEEHPELFSKRNVNFIETRQSPEVDQQWLKYHPGQEMYEHDRLVHHHWDQGPWAFGIPEHFHSFFHRLLHPVTHPD